MPKRIAFVEAEINRRLSAAVAQDSPNRITAAELRQWARVYLSSMDEEDEMHPEDVHRPHSNLWMRGSEDALFVVLTFRVEGVELYCGVGPWFAIRAVDDRFTAFEPDLLYEAMSEAFEVQHSLLRIERRAAALWLGRGWKP
jgi:hypothetical protein